MVAWRCEHINFDFLFGIIMYHIALYINGHDSINGWNQGMCWRDISINFLVGSVIFYASNTTAYYKNNIHHGFVIHNDWHFIYIGCHVNNQRHLLALSARMFNGRVASLKYITQSGALQFG